jgi:hypothetical protein
LVTLITCHLAFESFIAPIQDLTVNCKTNPEVLGVLPLPSSGKRNRREVLLVRLMLVAADLVVSGEGIGLQSARDLRGWTPFRADHSHGLTISAQ